MAAIVLTIKSARTDLVDRLSKDSSLRNEFFADVSTFLHAVRGRVEEATVYYQHETADPVAASGTITIDNSKLAADDKVTIAGVDLTAKASGTAADTFVKGGSSTATATNLTAAINAAAGLKGIVKASSSAGVVTVTCQVRGVIGNLVTLAKTENSSGAFTLSASALASGAGAVGAEVAF